MFKKGSYSNEYCYLDIDECASEPCVNGGTCDDLVNKFTCTCLSNYLGVVCDIGNACYWLLESFVIISVISVTN